ncbi:hypothetical protein [Microbispora sp. H10949]|uniref:hypothetical protein n=1 Tax=Microbispora sp. H10949 TaxID=2729111 RepID=UPI001603D0A9|nr:hypothetical protein [Microbispora sp. H10949]
MTTEETPPLARQLMQLRQDVNVLGAAVGMLPDPAALHELTSQLANLGQRVEALEMFADEKAAKTRPWDWSLFFPALEDSSSEHHQAAQQAWAELSGWVEGVLGRLYGLVAWEEIHGAIGNEAAKVTRAIPPCWDAHADLIIELGWLCQEWVRVYRTSYGNPAKAGDWHDRYLPGLRKRIATSSAARCRYGHLQDSPPAPEPTRYPYS